MAGRLNATLGRSGGGATVVTGAPMASDRSAQQTAFGEFSSGVADVTRGRVSLLMLNSLVLLLVVFYLWTRSHQGGG